MRVSDLFVCHLDSAAYGLATIEVRFQAVATRINSFLLPDLEESGLQLQENWDWSFFTRTDFLQMALLGGMWSAGAYFLWVSDLFVQALLVLLAPIIAVGGGLIAAFVGFRIYRFINTWVPGRTVGTLGIIIAGFGVLGEAYQFTTQLVT